MDTKPGSLERTAAKEICRGTVRAFAAGYAVVLLADGRSMECEILAPGGPDTAPLAAGDRVLCWMPSNTDEPGVILGRVVRNGASNDGGTRPAPEELILQARRQITLRVGDGSITIREDGSILIKGKDLVSHAKRRNRIRGGSVEIN